ncbi:hypothetical protein SESBI_10982 [Sesbania bispinosa]|nr:hypothetical protein SESBI_10982 [Sesbania bispinosa]
MEEITQFSGVVDTQSNLSKERENRAFRSVELEFYVVITAISSTIGKKMTSNTKE